MRLFKVWAARSLWLLALGVCNAFAAVPVKPLTAACLVDAARQHGVMPMELLAILYVERGSVGQDTQNTNKTYDISLFQINSIHIKKLKQYGISEAELRNDGCLSAYVAAWHLASVAPAHKLARVESEAEYFSILANYHSVTPKYNQRYAKLLEKAFKALTASDSAIAQR